MSKEFNLCEILRDRKGMKLFSTVGGECVFQFVSKDLTHPLVVSSPGDFDEPFMSDGRSYKSGEIVLFPSREFYLKYPLDAPRAWGEWLESQKSAVKTWQDLEVFGIPEHLAAITTQYDQLQRDVPTVIRSAVALLKIQYLIDAGYGGNVTNDEWEKNCVKCSIYYNHKNRELTVNPWSVHQQTTFSFHSKEQAEEFISHESNRQLLKDYYMV